MSKLSIRDVARGRGLSGTTTLDFRIVLDHPSSSPARFRAETKDFDLFPIGENAAKAGVDYDARTADLEIPAGQTEALFPVTIHGTASLVPDKFFMVQLSHANVPVAKPIASGFLKYGDSAEEN